MVKIGVHLRKLSQNWGTAFWTTVYRVGAWNDSRVDGNDRPILQAVTSQLAESQLAECLYVGVRNRVRARDRG